MRPLRGRHHVAIDDEVIDEVRAHGSGKSHVAHLHRGRPQRGDARARVLGEALDVHQDVDAVGMDARRGVPVGERPDVHEAVERRRDAPAQGTAVIRPVRVRDDLEGRPVVELEDFGHHVGHHMIVEVAGEVADAQPRTRPRREAEPELAAVGGGGQRELGGETGRARALLRGRGRQREQAERRDGPVALREALALAQPQVIEP